MNGIQIWWCIQHNTRGDEEACTARVHPLFDEDVDGDCRMRPALVIVREDGGWPDFVEIGEDEFYRHIHRYADNDE